MTAALLTLATWAALILAWASRDDEARHDWLDEREMADERPSRSDLREDTCPADPGVAPYPTAPGEAGRGDAAMAGKGRSA